MQEGACERRAGIAEVERLAGRRGRTAIAIVSDRHLTTAQWTRRTRSIGILARVESIAARAALSGAGRTRRVSEIAYHFGFGDTASFSRAFRQAFGASPSDIGGVSDLVTDTAEADIFAEWIRAVAP